MLKPNKTIITYGTFDLFHIGHLNLLKRLKKMGTKLIVGVSTDEFNSLKGKKIFIPYEQRAEIISNIKCVDLVIPENSWEQKIEDVKQYQVDVFVIGNDWKNKFDYLKEFCDVVYLERTKNVSTTQIKQSLEKYLYFFEENMEEVLDIIKLLKKDFE